MTFSSGYLGFAPQTNKDTFYDITKGVKKEIEEIDKILYAEEKVKETTAVKNYSQAYRFGITPEYIDTFNLLMDK